MEGTILLLFSVLSMITVSFQSCCPTNYDLHISGTLAICIREVTESRNYADALAFCESTTGGSLLKVDPISEVQAILDQLTVSVSPRWIGLDLNSFTWTADGTTPTSVNWSNDAEEGRCVVVNQDGFWSNVSCTDTHHFLCQVPVNCANPSCLTAVSLERCPCEMGFEKNAASMCVDINECANASPCNTFALTQCVNTAGGYDCVCVEGAIPVQGSRSCTENLCTMDADCNGVNMVCGNPMGSPRRCQCPTGFTGAGCSDIDECLCDSVSDQCVEQCQNGQCEMTKCAGANEVCQNGEGSFSCPCKPGFNRGSNNFCEDINECAEGMCVGQRQTCVNTPGGFDCTCDPGYELVNSVCIESCLGRCDPTTEICMMTPSPSCSCRTGYFLLDGACTDVDECGDSMSCEGATNMFCVNTPGSFTCRCLAGYTNLTGGCTDIDECATNAHDCTTTAQCTNTAGSFTCACPVDQVLLNGVCTAFRGFRVKIIAAELNDTVTTYQSSMDVIYERHFCQIILDSLQIEFPALTYDCSSLKFESGSVRGYLLLSVASAAISAMTIEDVLQGDVVTDVSGRRKLFSMSRFVSVTIVDTASSIDVVDIAVYNTDTNACDPSPCQNSAPCTEDRDVYDVSCICTVGFSGERCETDGAQATQAPVPAPGNDETSTGISTTVLVIIVVVFVVFILLFLLMCCCFCCYFFTQRGGIGSPGPPGPAFGGPAFGGSAIGGPGVAPIRGPHSLSGYGGYYDHANSVI